MTRPEPPNLTRLELVEALRSYYRALEKYLDASGAREHMHRSDLDALAAIMDNSRRGSSLTAKQLAQEIRLSTSATTALIDRLEQAGHVTRKPHPNDRRSMLLETTDRSRAVGRELFSRLAQSMDSVMEQFSEDEMKLVTRFLEATAAATLRAAD
ncbi:MarR family transcriptional regulator [Micrococcales bacterium 31B]|nr:MarR family transcriptional regulator [Micrococcales bacterium 31B]